MNRYSYKYYYIVQLKYLCEISIIYNEDIISLGVRYHDWVNNLSSAIKLQFKKLIEHIVTNIYSLQI